MYVTYNQKVMYGKSLTIEREYCRMIIPSVANRAGHAELKSMYTPIQPSKVFEQIAQQIEQRILSGELHSGDRLPTERELAEQFHASRRPGVEARNSLATTGLVETRTARG